MPFCSDTRCAVSSPRLSSAPASRSSACARSSADHDDQPLGSSNAARAARTAASMSAFVPSGTDPTGSSVLAAITDMRSEPLRLAPLTPDEKLVAVDGRLRAHRSLPCGQEMQDLEIKLVFVA